MALLLTEPGATPPPPRTIAAAVLSSLRELARQGPVLVAVDDAQWLDVASASALEFALRRIGGGRAALRSSSAGGRKANDVLHSAPTVRPSV